MKEKQQRVRLWRAVWVHRNGYFAPFFFVETSHPNFEKAKIEAIGKSKERSRLSDFPKQWSVRLTYLPDEEE